MPACVIFGLLSGASASSSKACTPASDELRHDEASAKGVRTNVAAAAHITTSAIGAAWMRAGKRPPRSSLLVMKKDGWTFSHIFSAQRLSLCDFRFCLHTSTSTNFYTGQSVLVCRVL